jgi:hypothetical protein
MCVFSALWRLKQEVCKFKASLGSVSNNNNKKQENNE